MEKFIKNLARGSGAILREGFKKKFKSRLKSNRRWDVVTNFDLAVDKFIIKRIQKKYPNHGIITEESGQIKKSKNFWILDPIDGTYAFVKGLDQFCISLAFVSNDILKFGVIYDPVRDELFFAQKNGGAYLNGRQISVARTRDMEFCHASIILGSGATAKKDYKVIFNNAAKYPVWFAKLESAALNAAYLAKGIYDVLLVKNLSCWDISAGALLMRESGAKVTNWDGKAYRWDSRGLLAANPILHKKALGLVKGL